MQNQRSFFWASLVLASVPVLGGPVLGCAPGTDLPENEGAEEHPFALENALLPDIVVRESDLHTNYLDVTSIPGRRLLRLSNGTANVGAGKLYLYGITPANPDGTQTVMQRVFNGAGEFEDRTAGSFTYHPSHSHVHFDGWASYRIRQVLPGDGVGDILAQGEKTSFCILDLGIYSSALPGFDTDGEFHSCGSTIQGLSVGWIDVYGAGLSGQSIDVTDVAEGTYWLESVVDPLDKVLESDETNNATRIKVTLGAPPLAEDPYEPNGDAAATSFHPVGAMNSSNLGPVNPSRTISGLSLHDVSDVDWFRFYVNDTGTAADFVRATHNAAQGDVDLELRDAAGNVLATSAGVDVNDETISLEGRAEGYYFAVVRAKPGAVSPAYSLTIDPPANQAPSIAITAPGVGNVDVAHAIDTYNATWTASDPEGDATWVTLWLNEQPSLDGTQIVLETSLFTPGEEGFHIVNTSYAPEGTYWVYAEVTDGGTTLGTWSAGTVSFVPNPECAHPVCQQGAKLNAPVCDSCTQQICAVDPYCCNTAWDAICVGEVASVCMQTCPGTVTSDVTVAARGARVVLSGTGLATATGVTIGGVSQTFTADATTITIASVADTTPVGSQAIVVTTPNGTAAGSAITVIDLLVNELDSDQTSTDTLEFIEIATGVPGVSLNGYSLVFFNGANDRSYAVISLDGVTTGPSGLAVVGNPGVSPAPQKTFANNLLQNGADAVAIYQGAYANNAVVTTTGLIDALVYDSNDADDAGLLTLALDGVQQNESTIAKTIKRCGSGRRLGGKFVSTNTPSPGAANGVTCN